MGTVSRPYTYTAGDVIQPAEVTDNETTLYTLVNGNLDNDNIDSSAAIKAAKLDLASATTASFSTNVLMSLSSTITLGTTTQTIAVGSSATVTITASGGVAEIGKMTVIASATVGNLKVSGTATLGALATLGTLVVSGTATISGLVCSGTATVGDLKVSNTVTIPNLVVSGTATLGNIIASGTVVGSSLLISATATLNSLVVTATATLNTLVVSATSTLKTIVVSGTATVGDLKVSNTVTLSNLTVSGTATLGNIINSGTAITNSLLVSATATMNSLVLSATATLNTLVVSATSTLKTIVVSGTATVGDLKVSNTVTLPRIVVSGTATIGNMIISGTATLKSIIVSGTATLGAMLVSGTATFSTVPLFPNNTIETADIQDNAVTLAKMAGLARGKVIYGDASGDPAALAVGATSTVLTTDGVDISWAAVSGGTSTYASIVVSGTATLGNIIASGTISAGTQTITTSAAGTALTITSSEAGAGSGPDIYLHRNSASPADDDVLGRVVFAGEDSGGNATEYASIEAIAKDVTGGTEDGSLDICAITNSAKKAFISIVADGTNTNDVVINRENTYSDFIVETANAAQTLWVQGSSDKIGINRTASMDANVNMCCNAANNQHISFSHPNAEDTAVGNINSTSSATNYVTSSDYRVKENIVPMENAIDRVKQLKPSRFNFIVEPNKTVDGFIAHEAQEIVPEAVTGEKDAMREDDSSKIIPQGIDQSKLVPLLCGALQEAISRIEQLESQIQG